MKETTIANILINEKLPQDMRDYSRVITGKELGRIAGEIGRRYPERYAQTIKDLKDLGDEFATQLGSSFSLDDFKPNLVAEKLYKKYQPAYRKIQNLPEGADKDNKRRAINLKLEGELNDIVAKDMQADNNRFTMWGKAGAKGGATNFRQMLYASGNQLDVKKELFPHMSKNSLSKGLTPSDFFITSLGARTGVVGSFNSVKEPGAYAKELYSATSDTLITSLDCGDTKGTKKLITEPFLNTTLLAHDQHGFPRNTIVEGHVLDKIKKDKEAVVFVRTPLSCRQTKGLCSKCYGIDENGKLPPLGDTIGLSRSQAIAEPLTQLALSAKHSGGVVGKKSAFELITQLFHAPENFTGGAVLTNHSGIVKKIEKNVDGGSTVWVDEYSFYLRPDQKPKVKRGQEVRKGDALSEGLVNPREIVDLKGNDAGRVYLSHALRTAYSDNGVEIQPKVIDTIVRSVLNHGKVLDVGDYEEELDIGELVSWDSTGHMRDGSVKEKTPYEAIGWRLAEKLGNYDVGTVVTDVVFEHIKNKERVKVYKEPAKIKAVMVATDQSALNKDFISAMNFRNIKRVLERSVTTAGKADIHGTNPITAYAYGAEMRHGEDGTF